MPWTASCPVLMKIATAGIGRTFRNFLPPVLVALGLGFVADGHGQINPGSRKADLWGNTLTVDQLNLFRLASSGRYWNYSEVNAAFGNHSKLECNRGGVHVPVLREVNACTFHFSPESSPMWWASSQALFVHSVDLVYAKRSISVMVEGGCLKAEQVAYGLVNIDDYENPTLYRAGVHFHDVVVDPKISEIGELKLGGIQWTRERYGLPSVRQVDIFHVGVTNGCVDVVKFSTEEHNNAVDRR